MKTQGENSGKIVGKSISLKWFESHYSLSKKFMHKPHEIMMDLNSNFSKIPGAKRSIYKTKNKK